jgi:hypothetical protein
LDPSKLGYPQSGKLSEINMVGAPRQCPSLPADREFAKRVKPLTRLRGFAGRADHN